MTPSVQAGGWIHVRQAEHLPSDRGTWFAVLESSSIYVPGDERSRTHPGHGYPGGSEAIVTLRITQNEELWRRDVVDMTKRSKAFRAFTIHPATIETRVEVEVAT